MSIKISELRIGDLVAFQIGTHQEFTSPNENSWGVIKVISIHEGEFQPITVSILAGLHKSAPRQKSLRFSKVLRERRFEGMPNAWIKKGPIFLTILNEGTLDLRAAKVIGNERTPRMSEYFARKALKLDKLYQSYGPASWAALSIDHEHRAIHDRSNWLAEIERSKELRKLKRQEADIRAKARLRGITLEVLTSETILSNWDSRSQIVPEQFTMEVRAKANVLLADLASLGSRPKRPAARKLLTEFMLWLNNFDEEQGHVIETEERDDLMQFLEEACWAIRQKPLLEEIDALRNW